jgi:hypothetical protein
MYSKRNKTKSPLFLLLVLACFGYACFKFAKVDKSIAQTTTSTQPQAQEVGSCSTITDDSSDTSSPVILNIDENGNITEISSDGTSTGSVLAVTNVNTCSITAANSYTATSACSLKASASTWAYLTGVVSTDATIQMTSITAPIKLLAGIFSVKDSNREITNETYTYKPIGEQFTDKQIASNTMPGDSTASTIIDESVIKKSYNVKYSATLQDSGGGAVGNTVSDTSTINTYYDNDCGDKCNNTANDNPDKSNKASKYLKNVYYDMPGEADNTNGSGSGLTLNGTCNVSQDNAPSVFGVPTCISAVGLLAGSLGNLFPNIDWIKCALGQETCVAASQVVVVMSPIAQDLNNYTSTRNKVGQDPVAASTHEPFYVLTPCTANIISNGIPHGVVLKCAWDLTYLMDEREAAQYDDLGKSDTPTKDQYVQFLKEEASNAGSNEVAKPM